MRFVIPLPSLQDSAMDQSNMALRVREVGPTTALTEGEEKYKFGSACTWGRNQLQNLGVEYKQKTNIKFKKLLRAGWGQVLQKRSSPSAVLRNEFRC